MKTFAVLFVFLQFAVVASIRKHQPVTLTLNAGKDIPVSGFVIDNSRSNWIKERMNNQLIKIKAVSKNNSDSISAIKSRLTDLRKKLIQKAMYTSDNIGYIGCYKDDRRRHLKYKMSDFGDSITLDKCREHCNGYKYTGLQYRTYCLCGNKLTNQRYPKVPESDCKMAIAGEINGMCGGASRNSIYLESATRDASIALYQYLCQEIVGSEESVKARRMMNNVRDYLDSNDNKSIITSGSFGEGLEMRGSDLDIMFAMNYIEVCEDKSVPLNPNKAYFIIEADATQPGYTLLRLRYEHYNKKINISEICEEIGGKYYCSNFCIKQRFINEFTPIVHGPCSSDKKGIFDFAYCLHYKTLIKQAYQWTKRSNNAWPEFDVKQSIVTHGVLFVPIGVKGSTKEDLEWRIWFSVGEKLLIYAFTHTQLLCYVLMKILLKDVIEIDLESKNILCTYFIKTILFWISEELPLTTWHPANLISSFMKCIKRLTYCVENADCPHYFIPENNLFEDKMKGRAQETLPNKLKSLNSYGWKSILFSNQINELPLQIQSETPTL